MEELKPCPFCGAPYPYITFEHGYIDDSAVIFCNACKISVKLEENDQEGFNEETKRKAIEAWNRRAEPQWIPCSWRLPKEEERRYWVCTDTGYQCQCRWTNDVYGFGESDRWRWKIYDIPQYQKVVAWMSLPEPYKGEE